MDSETPPRGSVRDPLMSVTDLAAFLGVPVATIYTWRKRGRGPRARRVGRHLRYLQSDVDQWLEELIDDGPNR